MMVQMDIAGVSSNLESAVQDLCNLLGINCVADVVRRAKNWDGLDIWSVRVWMIASLLAEGWW